MKRKMRKLLTSEPGLARWEVVEDGVGYRFASGRLALYAATDSQPLKGLYTPATDVSGDHEWFSIEEHAMPDDSGLEIKAVLGFPAPNGTRAIATTHWRVYRGPKTFSESGPF